MRIELSGLVLRGYHGVLDDERREGQRFVFDIEVEGGDEAARSDRIEDAVDYRELAAVVREVSDAQTYNLLEALATAVAETLLERFPVSRARVRVHKPDIRVDPPVDAASITVERPR